jgi:hypothetical protein
LLSNDICLNTALVVLRLTNYKVTGVKISWL